METITHKQKVSFAYLTKKGHQSIPKTFYLNGKFYNGRIEEARLRYQNHPEIQLLYSFEEWVDLEYYEFQKPVEAIKQELIDLCSKSMGGRDLTKALYLINKL